MEIVKDLAYDSDGHLSTAYRDYLVSKSKRVLVSELGLSSRIPYLCLGINVPAEKPLFSPEQFRVGTPDIVGIRFRRIASPPRSKRLPCDCTD